MLFNFKLEVFIVWSFLLKVIFNVVKLIGLILIMVGFFKELFKNVLYKIVVVCLWVMYFFNLIFDLIL